MIARLIRFYGGTLSDWMHTPLRVLTRLGASMATLEAEEQLLSINAALVPHMKAEDRRKAIGRLMRAHGRKPQRLTPETAKRHLEMMGIGVAKP